MIAILSLLLASLVSQAHLHLLFHCSAIDAEVRKEFLDKMRTLIPNFDTLNMEEQVDLFLAPDAPQEWDRTLYKFLGRVSDSL